METHRTKTTDANKATQAAFHIRVFERTVRPDQPANQSTLYGQPNTKRKSQTKDFLENQTSEPPQKQKPTKPVKPIWQPLPHRAREKPHPQPSKPRQPAQTGKPKPAKKEEPATGRDNSPASQ
jgi:hypothetical protein